MTAERHAVADLLTDKMRERVRATTFVVNDGFVTDAANPDRCPLAVAIDRPNSEISPILRAFKAEANSPAWQAIWGFIGLVDGHRVRPADVNAMLGCDS